MKTPILIFAFATLAGGIFLGYVNHPFTATLAILTAAGVLGVAVIFYGYE